MLADLSYKIAMYNLHRTGVNGCIGRDPTR